MKTLSRVLFRRYSVNPCSGGAPSAIPSPTPPKMGGEKKNLLPLDGEVSSLFLPLEGEVRWG